MRNRLSFITLLVANASLPDHDSPSDVIIGDWWDDVTNTVSDAAGTVWDNSYGYVIDNAVQYAKDHPDQVKALATAAATAAGTAIAGPAGGAIAGSIAGAAAGAAASGHDVAKAAENAAQQAANAAAQQALGIPADTHAALHQIALQAFLHGAVATKAINLTAQAANGDTNAQHALTQTAQAASQGDPVAQTAVAAAYHAAPAVSNGYASALQSMLGWHR